MNEPSSSKDSNIPEGAYDHTHNELPITPVETQILAGPSHSSRPSTPFPTSRPTTPHTEAPSDVQAEGLSSEERQLSENIGSIDVLGTLLSVAAAATAASLFSPGFSNSNHLNGPSPATGRPMSPTPTAGLGGFGGLNQLAELSLDHSPGTEPPPPPQTEPSQSDRDARDRIRGVWENFRDRLGLGARGASPGIIPAGPPTTGDEEPSTDRGYAQSARMRPGELMLAEMARALNAGLGLTGSSERRSSADQNMSSGADRAGGRASPQTTDAGERRPLSPDPGFEEFLTSLQADLRTVLSSHPPTEDAPSVPDHTRPSVSRLPQHDVDVPADVLPLADDDADSDVEEDTHPSPTPTERPMHHTRTPTPIPPPTTLPHVPSSDNEDENPPSGERRQPAINLWRVYRFPPIPAPPGHALRMSVLPQPGGPQESTPISPLAVPAAPGLDPSPYTRSAPSSATSLSSGPDQQPSAPQNVVVPVIVVGLQSVDTADRADFEDGSGMPQDEINGNDETDFETEDFSEPPHDSTANGRPATPRGRSWQSRAANALRGLRPGRRSSTGRRASESAGSRTFLIYVIGGYYPPNHHVVTGSDSLDSYEALWELADLLGQVKPPVATRDDIEKSGLEIVKASEMKHHEEEGRIASNCMERCLICLDDYEPEQNVRVMTCRHAFHKDCVDKWLQIGRNNCPACRSKGVSTSNDSTPPPPLPPHANPIL
ncbi:hypothetical protein EUX98_g6165 [Antrodiella citrinella]|uniref:RING-type E3 ubiquitin transferase n=1 Tax=Antrodiella citrinella TaxID=2447956 RepID=A0A4S4MQM1_9APHY|nr:hypothetical protein EUX98_g6165 [Antrodiella citrinella]